jgi:hypothetical protein
VDVELEKQAAWLAEYHQAELKKLSELRARYIENPMKHEALDEALALRKKVRADFVEHFQAENLPCEPGGFALHFWPCWFNADGSARSSGRAGSPLPADGGKSNFDRRARSDAPYQNTAGFDGIIGNPPWEGFKPFRKEFAANFYRGKPQFSKLGMDGPTFDKWFEEELKANKEFAARWREHEAYYERYKEFFGRHYVRQGTGDWNLFKLFIERDLSLVRQGGQFLRIEVTRSSKTGRKRPSTSSRTWTTASNSASSRWSKVCPRRKTTPLTRGFISTIQRMLFRRRFVTRLR